MKDYAGVYQLENGFWGYRFSIKMGEKTIAKKKTTDEAGNKLKTKTAAAKARAAAMDKAIVDYKRAETQVVRKTVKAVYDEYCEKGRSGKAYTTIKKQDSLWRNHIAEKFGDRFVDDIPVAEINDYLTTLYYEEGRSYRYVESFLKMFYLIFGQAYFRDYLDVDTYNKLCVNKPTKIKMPPMKVDDDDMDIIVFSREEMDILDNYFSGTNAETAYMLGKYGGLRINECYGLKWSEINFEEGTIRISRQMQYQNGLVSLTSLKTRNARRTIYMAPQLKAYLIKLWEKVQKDEIELEEVRRQNHTRIRDLDGEYISSLELVNSLPNGKMQTVNSTKYHAKVIREKLGIHFKYHYLRHTFGTRLAEMNTPTHLLCNQMGHANGKITQRYYLAVSKSGIEILTDNLRKL